MMNTRLFAVCTFLLCLCTIAVCDEIQMHPFPMQWRDNADSMVDMSFLLDAPAGKDGFIGVSDGRLTTPDGQRFRIWGVNATGSACFPAKADAGLFADHLARYGVNCVRFHFLDANWTGNVFVKGADNTRILDASQLDLFDYFVAQLKQRGIYSDINLNVGRNYRKADGVVDYDKIGLAKVLNYFDDRIQDLHVEYATQLLTHRNPYTKTRYCEEPAIVIVELVNENSLIEAWFNDRLLGKHTGKPAGTWQDTTKHYADLLTTKYNAWLKKRFTGSELAELSKLSGVKPGQTIPRLTAKQFAKAPEMRFHAEAEFYMHLETAYYQRMYKHLKETVGTKSLVAANSDHNHYRSGYALVSSTSKVDVVDGHVYWQHPKYITDPKTKRRSFWIKNSPMVDDPLNSTVVQLARTAVAGKPYTVSETNHPFPNEYACEGIPVLAAYAAFHDWDGLFFYTFEHTAPDKWQARTPGHFDIRQDPVRMTNIAAAASMFLRGDVRPANNRIARTYSAYQTREYIRASSSLRPFFTPGYNTSLALTQTTRIAEFDKPTGTFPEIEQTDPIVSDTGQLYWYHPPQHKGLVTVDTDRSQALIGFVSQNDAESKNLKAQIKNDFCSIILTSLDSKPIACSSKLLLAATARSQTTGMQFDEERNSLKNWGRLPMLIEPVRGTITLKSLTGARSVTATPLNTAGKPVAKPTAARRSKDNWQITTPDTPTTWYKITVNR